MQRLLKIPLLLLPASSLHLRRLLQILFGRDMRGADRTSPEGMAAGCKRQIGLRQVSK